MNQIVQVAENIASKVSYVWGADNPETFEFDCSSFTKYCYKQAGFTLPRTAAAQYSATDRVAGADLETADLVFFSGTMSRTGITHVGIYIGGGKFIHNSGRKDDVKISELTESYYKEHFAGGGRVTGASSVDDGSDSVLNDAIEYSSDFINGIIAQVLVLVVVLVTIIFGSKFFLKGMGVEAL